MFAKLFARLTKESQQQVKSRKPTYKEVLTAKVERQVNDIIDNSKLKGLNKAILVNNIVKGVFKIAAWLEDREFPDDKEIDYLIPTEALSNLVKKVVDWFLNPEFEMNQSTKPVFEENRIELIRLVRSPQDNLWEIERLISLLLWICANESQLRELGELLTRELISAKKDASIQGLREKFPAVFSAK